MKRHLCLAGIAILLAAQFGCRHPCARRPLFADHAPPKQIVVPPPPQQIVQPIGAVQPPGSFPVLPGDAIKPPAPSISKTPAIKSDTPWTPESKEPPRDESKRDVPPSIRLFAPEPIESSTQPLLPPIAQFGVAKDNVYVGDRPKLDGLEWLKNNRIATIIHIRRPDADDAGDRKQIEERGMKYIALDISPQTLTKEKAEEFIKLIRDHAKQGLFAYDDDGTLAGAMWYFHFRWGEFLADDASQLRTRDLGYRIPMDMMLAVQRVLGENNP
jgi:protein tyrosine phosphatase (PTP) superfamily phosphohydrolase (DUF442 family)